MRQSSDLSARSYVPATLHQLRRALLESHDALGIEGVRVRGADHSLHFELTRCETIRPLLSVWFNVERHQYTLMCRTTIIPPGRPMSDTRARLAEYLNHHAWQHGWRQASRH
ncbi:hypothetical protein [Kushneria marisflavi]|uniref:Uncharacterized protein n=1 Tax=Kushneria marisflavi TaxID=157779 RepID=A0A240UNF4_9GAMM|nr:hypothetical protein [Kushneria marisflavi]ART63008.1 hypothetical protein B9H00_08045 [Kushneria marisflavi]RKD84753.1 hypothetical protein C8D96_1979 [Kushneria marisflavi]